MHIYAKAIVAFLVPAFGIALEKFGVTPDSTFIDVVTAIITAGLVWFIPNKKK